MRDICNLHHLNQFDIYERHSRFNSSEFLGNAAAAGISRIYYPAAKRTAGEVGETFGMQVISDTAFNVLIEFWPDMRRMIVRKGHQ